MDILTSLPVPSSTLVRVDAPVGRTTVMLGCHIRDHINSRQTRACQGLGTRTATCGECQVTGRNETSEREKE